MEVQALWFEQWLKPELKTDDGRRLRVIQPGFWNHGAGPDFTQAALEFLPESSPPHKHQPAGLVVGDVEVHLRPGDWAAHGHHANPAYENTLLHVVWDASDGKTFYPATAQFRRVPQVFLREQLIAPWEELQPLSQAAQIRPLPGATPGRCSPVFASLPVEQIRVILRAAGRHRLLLKASRWHWWTKRTTLEQALFEALAEALGYHSNQIPMRLLAQRLPAKRLKSLDLESRFAEVFGVAGFLPRQSLLRLQSDARGWLKAKWEAWWKVRASLEHAVLPRSQWHLAGLRPLNRPERRLAALVHLVPLLPELRHHLEARRPEAFAQLLLTIEDPFWDHHATLTGAPLPAPCRLIGEERARDILLNLFWPVVAATHPDEAAQSWGEIQAPLNSNAKLAVQRTGVDILGPKALQEALLQQGLLQIFRDYCQTDCTQCQACTFPELVRRWESTAV